MSEIQPPEIHGTLHPKGSPEYNMHVIGQQEVMRQHLQTVVGRELTAEELAASDRTIADVIADFNERFNRP